MAASRTILILSDPHYASAAEQARGRFESGGIDSPLARFLIRIWRHAIWLRDPFAHNYHLDDLLAEAGAPDLVVANGDYSCDSAYIGLADEASCASARECLGKLRARFGDRLHTVMGDHELGKSNLAGSRGGMRLESWRTSTQALGISPLWQIRLQGRTLIGVTSSLIALDVFEHDLLPEEADEWRRLRAEHLRGLREIFGQLRPGERVILFCHDPSALPFLAQEDFIRAKLPQIERTIIGHLHTPMVYWKARLLAGFPRVHFLGRGIRRISNGLNRARSWRQFRVLLCPSLSGSELLKDGGYYQLHLAENAPAQFHRKHLRWRTSAPPSPKD